MVQLDKLFYLEYQKSLIFQQIIHKFSKNDRFVGKSMVYFGADIECCEWNANYSIITWHDYTQEAYKIKYVINLIKRV